MKVVVTGSRKWKDYQAIYDLLDEVNPDIVIHGGALGADTIAHSWCKKRGRKAYVFFPDYSKGKGAPLIRNVNMLEEKPDMVLGFPFPDSRGTRSTLDKAYKMGIPCRVVEGE